MPNSQQKPRLPPHRLSASSSPFYQHKKQISIESRVEQFISSIEEEEEGNDHDRWEEKDEGKKGGLYDGSLKRIDSISKVSVVISCSAMSGDREEEKDGSDMGSFVSWSAVTKGLTYTSLIFLLAITSSLKLLLVPFTSILSTTLERNYFSTNAALTGIPILAGAMTSLFSVCMGRVLGRRCLLLVGAGIMMIGTVWSFSMRTDRYAEILAARAFQGVGWGVVEGVLTDFMCALFAVDKQRFHQSIFLGVEVFFTWSSPVLSGFLSSTTEAVGTDFKRIFLPLVIAQSISVFLLLFFTPETASTSLSPSTSPPPSSTPSSNPDDTRPGIKRQSTFQSTISSGPIKFHATNATTSISSSLRSYSQTLSCPRPQFQISRKWSTPLKALLTPSAILRSLLIGPLSATAFGLASVLAFLFPNLGVRNVGEIFVLPASFGVIIVSLVLIFGSGGFLSWNKAKKEKKSSMRSTPGLKPFKLSTRPKSSGSVDSTSTAKYEDHRTLKRNRSRVGNGRKYKSAAIAFLVLTSGVSTLLFGCYVCKRFSVQIWDAAQSFSATDSDSSGSMMTGVSTGEEVIGMESVEMWWIVSVLFGLIVFASVGLSAVSTPGVRYTSTPSAFSSRWSSSSNNQQPTIAESDIETTAHKTPPPRLSQTHLQTLINSATRFYIHLLEGIFITTFPFWIGDGISRTRNMNGGLEIITGLRTLTVAISIIVGILGGVSAVGVVFGGRGLERRDLSVLGFGDEVLSDAGGGEGESEWGRGGEV